MKLIPNLDFPYYATEDGKIISHKLKRPLATVLNKGYEAIEVRKDGERLYTRVHRLVCLAYHGEPPTSNHCVNHKDGNKLNNKPDNLEWVTPSENSQHFYDELNGKALRPRGHNNHWRANYTDEEVRTIRKFHKEGIGYHKIRNLMGNKTSWVAIQMLIKGKTYTHVL